MRTYRGVRVWVDVDVEGEGEAVGAGVDERELDVEGGGPECLDRAGPVDGMLRCSCCGVMALPGHGVGRRREAEGGGIYGLL